jgi:anti-sigma factor RsiW
MSDTTAVTCESLLAQISACLDGDLGAATCEAIERHASSCDRCTGVIEEFRKATGLCRKAAEAPLPDAVRELAQARVRALLKQPPE